VKLQPEFLSTSAAVLAWIAFAYKLPALRRHPRDSLLRAFCATVFLMGLAIPMFNAPVNGVLDRLTGLTSIGKLLGDVLVVGSGCGVLAFLAYLSRAPERARRSVQVYAALALVTALAMSILFFLSPRLPETWLWPQYVPSPTVVGYRFVFLLYVEFVLFNVILLARRAASIPNLPSAQLGLALVAGGGLAGQVYLIHQVATVVSGVFGVRLEYQPDTTNKALILLTVVLLVLGTTMPNWGPRVGVDKAVFWVREYRSLRRLYPLWSALYAVLPSVALLPPTPRLLEAFDLRDVHFRLYRRVVEIRDAILLLNPSVDPRAASCARQVGVDNGAAGRELDVLVTAVQLASVLNQRRPGNSPGGSTAASMSQGEALDLGAEVEALENLARCYRRSPLVGLALELLESDPPTLAAAERAT
jgi:hypothetical protein